MWGLKILLLCIYSKAAFLPEEWEKNGKYIRHICIFEATYLIGWHKHIGQFFFSFDFNINISLISTHQLHSTYVWFIFVFKKHNTKLDHSGSEYIVTVHVCLLILQFKKSLKQLQIWLFDFYKKNKCFVFLYCLGL